MKFVIARFQHETNSFSPIGTDLECFRGKWGDEARIEQQGVNTAMGAFLDLAADMGADVLTPFAGFANPSGIVSADAYNIITDAILHDIHLGCDAILLDLHGAMIAANASDGEGELLNRIRTEFPSIPIAVALDLHANITPKMAENCDIMITLKTYPHIDMYKTGEHVGRLLRDLISGTTKPVLCYSQVPLLSHTMRSCTSAEGSSMQQAVAFAKLLEQQPRVLAASVAAGFSLADFHDAGMAVLIVTDGDEDLAEALVQQLQEAVWSRREGFVYESCPLSESLAAAQVLFSQTHGEGGQERQSERQREREKELKEEEGEGATSFSSQGAGGPVLLLDHSDNVMSGGTCDTTDVLEAVRAAGFRRVAAGPFCDPATVAQLCEVGVGSRVTIHLGNKSGWIPCSSKGSDCRSRLPLQLEGVVRAVVEDGQFKVTGPIFTGQIADMGKCVLFEIENDIELIISSERMEPYDVQTHTIPGVNIPRKDFLLLKSRMYCRPVFGPLSQGLVECDSDHGGPTSSNYANFSFKHIRKTVYPLYNNE